jgi:hypothetical protein
VDLHPSNSEAGGRYGALKPKKKIFGRGKGKMEREIERGAEIRLAISKERPKHLVVQLQLRARADTRLEPTKWEAGIVTA